MGSNGHWRCSCDGEGDMAREGSRRVAMRGIGSTWSDGSTLLHMATVRQDSRRTSTGETHGGRQEKAQGIARPGPALWKAVPRSRRWCWAASWWHEKGEEMEGINNNEGNKKGPTVGIEFLLTSHHTFLVGMGLVLITSFYLTVILDAHPPLITVLLFVPVTVLVIVAVCACAGLAIFCFEEGQIEENRRLQNSPV
ncbi:hypothetical protein OsI_04766 [Oryza sativa Indica Group]|uniref:Uncharacterized protein n=1 Tax=Oryza sativa subsp. indica TaxID=39946 RepID=B8A7U0_ORYSI|nr:hypothetical protein OsI_04766 [Oryza sativa Indica Group]